ncbi:MAG TPA: hypothetical protein VK820_03580 [Steroidobacteraceae bacterium]|jgi:hypothetical protein|nr:hypothetical protein [Steroidobacteraceae bacterium]
MRLFAIFREACTRCTKNGVVKSLVAISLCLVPDLLGVARGDGLASRFDGIWDTRLSCGNSNGALGYSFEFNSIVNNSVLHGEKGTKEQPGWLQLDGRISADGSASIYARGRVGAAPYAVGQRPAGQNTAMTLTPNSPTPQAAATGSKAGPVL